MYSALEEDLIYLMKYLSLLTCNCYLDKLVALKYIRIINEKINDINNSKDKRDNQDLQYDKISKIINYDDDKIIDYLNSLELDEEMMRKRSKVIILLLGSIDTSLKSEINNILNVMKEEENDKYIGR